MPKDLVALLFQSRTLDKRRLTWKSSRLSDELIAKVALQIALAFGLETCFAPPWIAKLTG